MIYADTRAELLRLVPMHGDCCEIGVFNMEFAKEIAASLKPSSLTLIDPFEGSVFSADKNGGSPQTFDGDYLFRQASEWCAEDYLAERTIYRMKSSAIMPHFVDDYFDFVYIDGDHTYEACRFDLSEAWRTTRPGGWIGGHDYSIYGPRCEDSSYFLDMGVKAAVDEFCRANGVEIFAMAMDGYTSYLIRKPE